MASRVLGRALVLAAFSLALACRGDVASEPDPLAWSLPIVDWPAGLLSVSGTAADDVWVVGAAHEGAATILHWDGAAWESVEAPTGHTVWWVHAVDRQTAFFGGEHGQVLRWRAGVMERLPTPALARQTVFGVWARAVDDVYAVGGVGGRSGFVWHWDGERFTELPLPRELPRLHHGASAALFKVWGDADDVWVVGALGQVLRRRGDGPFELVSSGEGTLLTVAGHASGEVLAVGGGATAIVETLAPSGSRAELGFPFLQGVTFAADGTAWASGGAGTLLRREQGEWRDVGPGFRVPGQSLHAVWVAGVLLHGARGGRAPSSLAPPTPREPIVVCTEAPPRTGSVARAWNEVALGAIRRALPEPTVHARNLYHLSLVLHDAWATFEPDEEGLIVNASGEGDANRPAVMSHAAAHFLRARYAHRVGGDATVRCLEDAMAGFELAMDDEGASARLGREIAQGVLDAFANDGSLEHLDYADPDYRYGNPSLRVDEPGIDIDDLDTWQPIDLAVAVTQNGISEASGPQRYIGPHWGRVVPFAIRRPEPGEPYFDAGPRPTVAAPEMAEWVLDVLRRSAWLDVGDGETLDISPGRLGNNALGFDDGVGHALDPETGEPFAPEVVLRGDFGRVLAEYWADGPRSETPPGHWNVLAHQHFAHPTFERRWMGEGEPLEPLAWDVRALLVLNGALHDAAIVAWETKRNYESARPVSLIRGLAALGQRTDPSLPSYDPRGLPLEAGLVELITAESAAPDQRHAHLAAHVGEIAIWGWPGDPGDPDGQRSRFQWLRAAEWMPYQPRTFVTPAFPGFVSGHSTFSRAAADVLTALVGSPWVPSDIGEHVARRDEALEFERGPSADVRLRWATWQDAADQAGQSRIWGGIHIAPDDHVGRVLGASVASRAVAWARARWGEAGGARPGVPTGSPDDVPTVPPPLPDEPFPRPEGTEPDGDAELRVGTGRAGYAPLRHGDALRWEAGVQGGFHVWASAAVAVEVLDALSEDARRDVRTRFTLTRRDGDALADLTRIGGYRAADGGWALWGSFAILRPGIRPQRLDDEPMRLTARVELPDGRAYSSEVWVRSACCD